MQKNTLISSNCHAVLLQRKYMDLCQVFWVCCTSALYFVNLFVLIGNEGISEEKRAKKMPETALGHSMMDSALALGRDWLEICSYFILILFPNRWKINSKRTIDWMWRHWNSTWACTNAAWNWSREACASATESSGERGQQHCQSKTSTE